MEDYGHFVKKGNNNIIATVIKRHTDDKLMVAEGIRDYYIVEREGVTPLPLWDEAEWQDFLSFSSSAQWEFIKEN